MSFQFTAMTLTFGQWRHVYFTEKNKKLELMLMRHVKAYSSSCSQTVSLSPAISSQFILGVCAAAENRKKVNKNSIF